LSDYFSIPQVIPLDYAELNIIHFFPTDSTSSTSTHDTFCLQPGEGYLEAHITHISDSKCLLKVFFTAK